MSEAAIRICLKAIAFAVLLFPSLTGALRAQPLIRADNRETPYRSVGARANCTPTLIFSHGFGGDERAAEGLANGLAAAGWRVIVIGHRESGRQALASALQSARPRDSIMAAVTSRELQQARFLDLDAAIGLATVRCRPSPFVLAGHSMGAITAMLEAGTVARFGRLGGDRFDAYVALSPQGEGSVYAAGAWSGVRKPVLMITGTRDDGTDGDFRLRISAFDGLPPGRKRLAVISGARHLELSGGEGSSSLGAITQLVREFVEAIRSPGPLPPSRAAGVDIRDK